MAFDITKFASTLPVSDSDTQMQEIPLDHIAPNPGNFYPLLEDEDMLELENSIRANGLLEPLTVVPDEAPGRYRLISGHNRYTALRNLKNTSIYRNDEPHKWDKVLCMILPAMSRDQETSAIIEANRQRRKSSALLAQEAERLTESYVARKKAGEDLPGRIRERVAEALKVSQTKLATIKAIKDNLSVPGFKRAWEKEELPESVAYEISKLETEAQYRLLDYQIDSGETLSIRTVKQFGTAWVMCRHKCEHTGRFCENAMRMVRGCTGPDGWQHCAGCCAGCLRRDTCPYVCQHCKPAEPPAEAAPAEVPDWQKKRDAFASRLRELREATGLSRAEFSEQIDEHKATYSAWENGNLPGCDRMPKLAKALGVTTDYLFGLSEDPHGEQSPQTPAAGDLWQPLDEEHWPKEGAVVVLRGKTPLDGWIYQAARCQGGPVDAYPFEEGTAAFDLDQDEMKDFEEWTPLVEGGTADAET